MIKEAWPFEPDVREIVALLAQRDYAAIERRCGANRLSAVDMASAVAQYGRRIAIPPDNATPPLEVAPLLTGDGWAVDVPLWTTEEGRSDLTLQLTVRRAPDGGYAIEIDDLHVL